MAKYSFKFKKSVVEAYLKGEGGYRYLSQKYGVESHKQVCRWVKNYQEFGDAGLIRSREKKTYSFEFKLHVVELYLTSEVSYQELALSQGMNNPTLITRWVNDFKIAGPDALRPKKKGRKKSMAKDTNQKRKSQSADEGTVDTSKEYVKQLEDELLKLRIENAYLKELYWQKRFDRVDPNKELEEHILDLHKEHKDFGYRRMKAMLQREGICVNKKKVQRIMQKLGLQITSYTRKSRRYNSYKGKVGRIAPNRINRRFHTTIPHQKITTDTTEFKYYEIDGKGKMAVKKLYLDPFLDMFNGEIMSYSISKTPSAESILPAQKKAIEVTSDCQYKRTFHSDRGWAYQMRTYSNRLKENKIFQSMSRKGNCYDNSVMENFFGILKQEMYYGNTYYSFEELKEAIEKYIVYYNEKRIKKKLEWKSPVEYRQSAIAA